MIERVVPSMLSVIGKSDVTFVCDGLHQITGDLGMLEVGKGGLPPPFVIEPYCGNAGASHPSRPLICHWVLVLQQGLKTNGSPLGNSHSDTTRL